MFKSLYLLLFASCLSSIPAYKILIFSPTNSRSHMLSNGRIGDTLAKDGHSVTVLEAEFRVLSKDVQSVKVANRLVLSGFDSGVFNEAQASLISTTFDPPPSITDHFTYPSEFFDAFNTQCDKMWEMHKERLLQLKDQKFDMIMTEQLNLCGVGLQAALNIKSLFWISSCPLDDHMADILRVPTPLSYVPSVGEISVSDKMSIKEKLRNMLEFWRNTRAYGYGMSKTDEIYQKHFGKHFPSVVQLARDSVLTFVLADEFLDFPRPILHNTVYVGGLGMGDSKPVLNEDFASEMEKGKKGVIFFSFGTNIETMELPLEFKENFFKALQSFPEYHFIVRFDKNDVDARAEAAKLIKHCTLVEWAPQPAILAHPRLKLFITHGGYNSLLEAANYAIPLLLMPMFGDQWRNAQLAERNGFGLVFEKRHLLHSKKEFVETLKEMLENPIYKLKSQRIQKLIKTKPMNATHRLLSYVRFVGDNDGILPELQIYGRELGVVQYYNIDVIAYVIFCCLIIPGNVIFFIYILIKKLQTQDIDDPSSVTRRTPPQARVVGGRRK